MNNDEKTFLFRMKFPEPWPVSEEKFLSKTPTYALSANKNGSITIRFFDGSVCAFLYTTPIIVAPVGMKGLFLLGISWKNGESAKFYLNGKHIITGSVSLEDVVDALPVVRSIDCPDVDEACRDYVSKRYAVFSLSQTFKDNRVAISIDDQLSQLRSATENLIDFRKAVLAGDRKRMVPLVGQLRALLYYRNQEEYRTPTYNPLLLRLAGISRIPLSVFSFLRCELPDFLNDDLELSLFDPMLSIEKIVRSQKLSDLCYCLESEVFFLRRKNGSRPFTLKDLIGFVANTEGVHYDETIPVEVDYLKKVLLVDRKDFVQKILLDVAEVTIHLSFYLYKRMKCSISE
jgi:hypothetical protein